MNIINIATTNQKGQLVIPVAIRNELGITKEVPLHISLRGNAIYIVPIKDFITTSASDSSYRDILAKTQGSWINEKTKLTKKPSLELKASTNRKLSW